MAEPVRARRLSEEEGRRLQQIVRRGKHEPVRVRRAMIIVASAPGTLVPAIARLVAAGEDTVRDVIHLFNATGLAALDPQWAGGRPRLISDEDIEVIVTAARTRPEKPGRPFARWSLRKLAGYLAEDPGICIGRERLRQVLRARGISFQRTRTWKEPADPDRDAKLDRIEYVTSAYPDRCFASGQFGSLSIRPCHGTCRAPRKHPARLRATCHRTHGIRYFHGCCSLGDGQLRGVTREHKGGDRTLAALTSVRGRPARRLPAGRHHGQPGGEQDPGDPPPGQAGERRAVLHARERVLGQPGRGAIRALAHLVMGNPDYRNHPALARRLQDYLRWRNARARHPRHAGRPAPRTRPHRQRTPATPGPPRGRSRMIRQ